MSQNQPSRTETAEKISVLIRIYRAAVHSSDAALSNATASELKAYGVDITAFDPIDLANTCSPLQNRGEA